ISEHLRYYFDPAIQHDVWLSFTESLKQHLYQLNTDLQTRQASPTILEMLGAVMLRLDANYPSPQQPAAMPIAEEGKEQAQLPDCELAESDCHFLQTLCKDLIGDRGLTHIIFLKTLA